MRHHLIIPLQVCALPRNEAGSATVGGVNASLQSSRGSIYCCAMSIQTRILMVHAINPFVEAQRRYPPLGLGYLMSMLKREFGSDVEILLIDWGIEDAIRTFRPDLMCLSSVSQNFNLAKRYAVIAKEAGLPVIVGGFHITELPENLTQDMDVGVLGEGEYTLVELVRLLRGSGALRPQELAGVAGIIYWDGGEQVMTPPRDVIGHATKNLDEIPMPDRSMMRIRPHTNMLTSRGCPYNCTFCASTRFWPSIRYFSPEYILDEVRYLRDHYGVRYITFHDDLFIANVKRLEAFHDLVLEEGLPKQGFRFSCASSATRITGDMARMLKEMNFVSVSMGLESGNQEVLRRLKGPAFKVEINEQAVRTLHRHGIHPHASFIIGETHETLEQMEDTYAFIKRNPLSLVNIYVLTPLPGTQVWYEALERGLVSPDMNWDRLNIEFELDWKHAILLSQEVAPEELHRMYQRLKRLRLIKYARAAVHHPFRMDLLAFGRAKIIEKTYRLKNRITSHGGTINRSLVDPPGHG